MQRSDIVDITHVLCILEIIALIIFSLLQLQISGLSLLHQLITKFNGLLPFGTQSCLLHFHILLMHLPRQQLLLTLLIQFTETFCAIFSDLLALIRVYLLQQVAGKIVYF